MNVREELQNVLYEEKLLNTYPFHAHSNQSCQYTQHTYVFIVIFKIVLKLNVRTLIVYRSSFKSKNKTIKIRKFERNAKKRRMFTT